VKRQAFLGALVLLFGISACSQTPEVITTPEPPTVVSTPSSSAQDPCDVLDHMEKQFSESVAGFIENPSQDALTVLQNEFNAQIELLYLLIESSNLEPETKNQLDNALSKKDEAVRQYTESTQTDNILQKGVLLAGAVVAAQDAVSSARGVLENVNAQLACPGSVR
jgi:hypothetical protein